MMTLLLRLFSWRHCRLAPGATILLVLILAVGVAAYLSVRLANRAAAAGFAQFTNLLTTQSDWVITPPAGRLPESILPELRRALGDLPVHIVPVVESTATPPRAAGGDQQITGDRLTCTLTGLDLLALQNLPVSQPGGSPGRSPQFWRDFLHPRAIFITAALAKREGLEAGQAYSLVINDRIVECRVAAVIPAADDGPQLPETLLLMDLPKVQELTGRIGQLDRVEFLVETGPLAESHRLQVREALERISGGRWNTASPNERRESAETMTRAFSLNLTILSLLALLVGLYLIFQALDGAVVRRREEIGILRSLGVTSGAIRRAWVAEAALLGTAGGVLGALLGWAAAQWTVLAVGRTVNALYYASSARTANLHAVEFFAAVALGCGAGILAGWWPARNAALTPPAQILRRNAVGGTTMGRHRAGAGAILLLLSGLAALLPPLRFADGGRIAAGGYLSALLGLLGGGLLSGPVLHLIGRLFVRAGNRSAPLRVAFSHLRTASSRHRTAAAGLLCATAMTAGMAIMIGSFDSTMRRWIDQAFIADLYISSDGAQSASSQNRIPPSTWKSIVGHPDAGDSNVVQALPVEIDGKRTLLAAGSMPFLRVHQSMTWVESPLDERIFDTSVNTGLCLVSEAFAERFAVARGDRVTLPTPAGSQRLEVAGVFADYGNERGTVLIDREHFVRLFSDQMAASIVLFVKPGRDPAAVRAALQKDHPGLSVFTNASLRAEILRVFRQAFAITWALEIIGLIVAVAGLGLSLASMLVERRGELSTLRSLGMTHGEIARAAAAEGAGIALGGVLPGMALSLGLGWILIRVINKQTFGWTLMFNVPWADLLAFAAVIMTSAALTGWLVGRRAATLPADREE